MSGPVFRQALRQAARTIVVISIVAGAFYFLILLSSISFLKGSTTIGFFEHPPKAIEAFLGGSANFLEASGWLAAGMTHPVTLSLLTVAATVISVNSVATEVERGTIDLVLSRPVGRNRYLVGRATASVVAVTAVEVAGLVGVLVARATISEVGDLDLGSILLAFLQSWLLFVAFSMVALLASARTSLRGRALGIAVGAVVGWFFLNFLALLIDGLNGLRYLSPFHYFRPGEVLEGAGDLVDFVVLAALAFVALALALQSFRRRDLAG
jgi:ABC-2 type transport system permease protein